MVHTANREPRKTMSLPTFFDLLDYNRTSGYRLAREDRLPVPVIRIGRRMVVSVAAVEELLNRRKDGHADAA